MSNDLTAIPASFAQRGDIPAQLNRMDFLRRRDYRDNLRFYYGFQWPAPRINQRRRRLVFNYAKTLIEKVTSYLMQGRTIVVVPDSDSRAARRSRYGPSPVSSINSALRARAWASDSP